jgi:hypothetical protein
MPKEERVDHVGNHLGGTIDSKNYNLLKLKQLGVLSPS